MKEKQGELPFRTGRRSGEGAESIADSIEELTDSSAIVIREEEDRYEGPFSDGNVLRRIIQWRVWYPSVLRIGLEKGNAYPSQNQSIFKQTHAV